jgi:hypothetical protein
MQADSIFTPLYPQARLTFCRDKKYEPLAVSGLQKDKEHRISMGQKGGNKMFRRFQMVMGFLLAVVLMQSASAAWAKDTMRVTRQPGATIKAPNTTVKGSEVQKTFKPDLVVSMINFSPGLPVEGDEVTLWVFVKNKGMAQAGA